MALFSAYRGHGAAGKAFVGRGVLAAADPLQAAARANLLVPRTPSRYAAAGEEPTRIDRRQTRATEIIQDVINGLAANAAICRQGVLNWIVPAKSRVVADADSFNGEFFFSADDLEIKYKSPGGVVQTFSTGGGADVDGGSP